MHTSPGVSVSEAASCCPHHVERTGTPYDGLGARRIIEAWLAEHGADVVDDEGTTLSDLLEIYSDIYDDLERRIALALGALAVSRPPAAPTAADLVRSGRVASLDEAVRVLDDVDDGCFNAGATDTPGLHRPDCNAIRNGGPCDVGRGAVSQ